MLHHMLYSDMKIIYDIIYDIISYVVYYIIYELTVYGTDRNPSFDEYGVDIQHNGDRNLARTNAHLGNVKGDRSIGVPSKGTVPIGICVLFELVELAAFEPFVRQQLPKNNLHPPLKESDILLAITFLPHVKDIHLPVLNCLHQPRVHVVINISCVEFGIV